MFSCCLSGAHFLSAAICMRSAAALGIFNHSQAVPIQAAVIFAMIGSVSIGSANVSLLLNSVSFYQISKLLLTPLVCLIEATLYHKRFSISSILSMLLTCAGVMIVITSSVTPNSNQNASISLLGLIISAVFLISSAFQQILTRQYQVEFDLQPYQLLCITAPFQSLFLLALGPSLDLLITKEWIITWLLEDSTSVVLGILGLTCIISVLVNLSQFLCLGRFSATTFQVMGHLKTISILIGGVFLFGETLSRSQVAGMALAVLGMILYSFLHSENQVRDQSENRESPLAPISKDPERMNTEAPLLVREDDSGKTLKQEIETLLNIHHYKRLHSEQ